MPNKYVNMAQADTPPMIRDRKPFNASSLTGRVVEGLGYWDSGRLKGADLDKFRADCTGILYVVYSYTTPIAWYTEPGGVGTWHVVSQRFSTTTSTKHQSRLWMIPQPTMPV